MIRKKARDEGRTIADVKDELNIKRLANGIIPVINGTYGVHEVPPRTKAGGRRAGLSVSAPAAVDSNEATEDASADSGWSDELSGLFEDGLPGDEPDSTLAMAGQQDEIEERMVGSPREGPATEDLDIQAPSASDSTDVMEGPSSAALSQGIVDDHEGAQVTMPREVLCNDEALRLWALGYRDEAVEKAKETKAYLDDFDLRPEQLD